MSKKEKTETAEEAIIRKAADAKRKRDERAAAKVAKANAATTMEIAAVETLQDFWAVSLKGLDEKKLAEWSMREEYVLNLISDIKTVMEGRSPDDEFEADVIDEIKDDVKQYGIAGITVPALIGNFWRNPELLNRLTSGDSPSAVFAKFGILLAVDDHTLHRWEQFVQGKKTNSLLPLTVVQYVPLYCTGCNTPPKSVSVETAAHYARTKDFLCSNCLDRIKKTAGVQIRTEFNQPEASIFDGYGRVRD